MIVEFQEIETDYCGKCAGLWFDAGELEELLRKTGALPDESILRMLAERGKVPPGRKNLCPRCDRPLEQIELSCSDGSCLVLDTCSRGHGIWFDKGELKQLLDMFPSACQTSRTVQYVQDVFGAGS